MIGVMLEHNVFSIPDSEWFYTGQVATVYIRPGDDAFFKRGATISITD